MKKIIELKDVTKNKILENINLEIQENEIIAIMGNSGVGKTTLLNIMSGLEEINSGTVNINEVLINTLKGSQLTKFRSQNIGYIFQDYKLVDFLSVRDNITFIEDINKISIDKAKVDLLIKKLRIDKILKNKITQLSGGQKQRVAIARSIIGNNKLIFADEPTGALDPLTRNEIINELVKNAQEFSKTLIIVTHDPYVALQTNKIIFLNNKNINDIVNTQDLTEKQILNKLESLHNEISN
ncbi:ABC transporter ATP-binding protein [Spiroplasma culicicola]|uniref:ABC transporter ATP-binding protein n=1 Tax=Spiroplasma culicicola AES-1 TaxID=1276246 RepID=W6A6N1_9MOLU|nr:ABC transporter ATP-binding protein [Spiroplasma culicicola]AHI52535.1 ABC transporter ATP-binding protein [Spiroplasma culicicola AES-1]